MHRWHDSMTIVTLLWTLDTYFVQYSFLALVMLPVWLSVPIDVDTTGGGGEGGGGDGGPEVKAKNVEQTQWDGQRSPPRQWEKSDPPPTTPPDWPLTDFMVV